MLSASHHCTNGEVSMSSEVKYVHLTDSYTNLLLTTEHSVTVLVNVCVVLVT